MRDYLIIFSGTFIDFCRKIFTIFGRKFNYSVVGSQTLMVSHNAGNESTHPVSQHSLLHLNVCFTEAHSESLHLTSPSCDSTFAWSNTWLQINTAWLIQIQRTLSVNESSYFKQFPLFGEAPTLQHPSPRIHYSMTSWSGRPW